MMEFSRRSRNFTLVCMVLLLFSGHLAGVRSERRMVKMTLVAEAEKKEAVCLDGSLPGYHLDRGFGSGVDNWLLQFEGGGWCNDIKSCLERAGTYRGSTTLKNKWAVFSGILSNNKSENPDFYNWNRVKLRYCDGASFAGDSQLLNGTTRLYFRGERIWEAFMFDLLPKGLNLANKALLSGSSAGGLATFLHCDKFTALLSNTATVKCLSDAGFFLDVEDVTGSNTIRPFFQNLVELQGVEKNLDGRCTASLQNPSLCFFPQFALPYIQTPYFILNAAYDTYQFNHIFVPPYTDPKGEWLHCKSDITKCTQEQLDELEAFRIKMLAALHPLNGSSDGGLFINSCYTHGQSELQDAWFAPYSPRLNNKTIAEAVGDWYFGRNPYKGVDCQYPCNNACVKLTNPSKGIQL